MNYSTAVMLINQNIRAVLISYETDKDGKGIRPYTMFKTLDRSIKVGDLVVVPTDTRHKNTVVRVEEVDVDVDFESPVKVDWIAAKVDMSSYVNIQIEESKWIDALKASEKRRKREDIKKNMLEMYDEGIEKLPIAKMEGVTAIEQKKEEV